MPVQDFAYSLIEVHTNACFCLFVDSSTNRCSILPILWPKYVPMHALACSLTQVAYIPMQHFAYSLIEVHTNACFCLFVDWSTYHCRIVPIRWRNYTAMRDLATLWLKCRQSQAFAVMCWLKCRQSQGFCCVDWNAKSVLDQCYSLWLCVADMHDQRSVFVGTTYQRAQPCRCNRHTSPSPRP